MAKLLYITAHPNDHSQSFSMAAGQAFIDSYKEQNPNDEIVHIDLYKEGIPHIDNDVFSGWGKLQSGKGFDELSNDEKSKVSRLGELSDQFVGGDKYVFVTPMWNFSFPPVLKAYIDSVAVAGKTFKYTDKGSVGLLTDKKALHIQARGGIYSEGPAAELEMGHRYLNAILVHFFGIPALEGLFIEGQAAMPDKAQEIKDKGIARAKDLAKTF
ncbi:FMN-dependent NADH-azoreductase [Niallia taxi]|uniref:FMN dependent NADH:quinone oxidoreductase n=1 Tax=Niallia taxi TaxID=2499688 RepID=A0A3S2W5X9_9BACI|nr:FMN-dependent NADH-azoreductase [Niallia taxi]MDK8641740.1 FMN-dependent NADH-azoreductase [Niallia taxi]MED4038545.1 FMN-dependent NADH-azoreductase [Niallia taxi]MED4056662.1 FMN-dependent NADH-azoreductase [Niallia taxi]MED4117423.1 FMN-dependent NADH-azoreductase [Niallia taxi]RVT65533.1 FMN-dependent NADH-azoreductase [Niallia taxi]